MRDSEAQYSPQVCRIAHDLLVSSGNPRDAVHTFALLRGFALRSQFLRGLWNAITAGNASSATLSLPIVRFALAALHYFCIIVYHPQALIRAISNKDENEDLVTGFAVFVSLFSYNLLTVHDMGEEKCMYIHFAVYFVSDVTSFKNSTRTRWRTTRCRSPWESWCRWPPP